MKYVREKSVVKKIFLDSSICNGHGLCQANIY